MTFPSGSCEANGIKIPAVFFSAAITSGRHDLRKMRRANFFFAFSHQNKVDRQLAARTPDSMQRRKKCGFRPFLIDRPAPDYNFAEARLINNAGLPRR